MQDLRVPTWDDWEELSRWLLTNRVYRQTGVRTSFHRYGARGQGQHGIDLIAADPHLNIVAQCKHVRTLTLDDVKHELKKTDRYPERIDLYVVMTTSTPHVSIQSSRHGDGLFHRRPDGSNFRVEFEFWDHLENLHGVPVEVIRRVFPRADAERLAGVLGMSATADRMREHAAALQRLREVMPRYLTSMDIDWLETWQFSHGYLRARNYQPFNDLYIEFDRTRSGVTRGIAGLLSSGNRSELAQALPAAERFFSALSEFMAVLRNEIIGYTAEDGQDLLVLPGFPDRIHHGIAGACERHARYLARVYREDILGQSSQD